MDFGQQVRDLLRGRVDKNFGVDEARGADDLFGDASAAEFEFEGAGGRGCEDDVFPSLVKFLEAQRAVVEGAGQAEAVLDEDFFSAAVAGVHSAKLRNGDVRFVDEEKKIIRKIIEQGIGSGAGLEAGHVPGVVFDAAAIADFLNHLEVVECSGFEALGFEQFAFVAKLHEALLQFLTDALVCGFDAVGGQDIVFCREDENLMFLREDFGGDGIDVGDFFDAVAEKFEADGEGFIRGPEFDDVAADAKRAACEVNIFAIILQVGEFAEEFVAYDFFAETEADDAGLVIFGRAEAEDARDAGDNNNVLAAHQAGRGGEAQAVELVVAGGVFFDVDVTLGDVGLGLIIVIIADEVFDGVFGEELAEFFIELCGEGLVVRDDESGFFEPLDDVGHGEGFSAAGNAQQGLMRMALPEPFGQLLNGPGLVALRLKFAVYLKIGHV